MIAVLAGLASAVVYGVGDFVGGYASRRIAPVRVVAVSAMTGVAILLPLSVLVPARWSAEAVIWGAASGVANSMGILLLYAALSIGPMSILSPLTALLSAVIPIAVGLAAGDQLSSQAWIGIVVALVAVLLVGLVRGEKGVPLRPRGLAYAVGSGVLIGVIIILLDRAPLDSGLVPLLFNRAASGLILTIIVVVLALRALRAGTPLSAGWRAGLLLAPLCGVIDTVANALILVALRSGELGITSVLVAMYPAATIVLAALVLRERLSAVQWAGLVLALGAAGLLALA